MAATLLGAAPPPPPPPSGVGAGVVSSLAGGLSLVGEVERGADACAWEGGASRRVPVPPWPLP